MWSSTNPMRVDRLEPEHAGVKLNDGAGWPPTSNLFYILSSIHCDWHS